MNHASKWKISRRIGELAPWRKTPNQLTKKQKFILSRSRNKNIKPQDFNSILRTSNKDNIQIIKKFSKNQQTITNTMVRNHEQSKENSYLLKTFLQKQHDLVSSEMLSIQPEQTHILSDQFRFKTHVGEKVIIGTALNKPLNLLSLPLKTPQHLANFFNKESSIHKKNSRQNRTNISLLRNSRKLSLFYSSNQKYFSKKVNKWKQICMLEIRLVSILSRAFGSTIYTSNQLINHKKVRMNGKLVNKPNILCNHGDIIILNFDSFKDSSCYHLFMFIQIWTKMQPVFNPVHLEVNYITREIILLYEPRSVSFPYGIDLTK